MLSKRFQLGCHRDVIQTTMLEKIFTHEKLCTESTRSKFVYCIGALNDSPRDDFNSTVARLRKEENLNEKRAKSVLENNWFWHN